MTCSFTHMGNGFSVGLLIVKGLFLCKDTVWSPWGFTGTSTCMLTYCKKTWKDTHKTISWLDDDSGGSTDVVTKYSCLSL